MVNNGEKLSKEVFKWERQAKTGHSGRIGNNM